MLRHRFRIGVRCRSCQRSFFAPGLMSSLLALPQALTRSRGERNAVARTHQSIGGTNRAAALRAANSVPVALAIGAIVDRSSFGSKVSSGCNRPIRSGTVSVSRVYSCRSPVLVLKYVNGFLMAGSNRSRLAVPHLEGTVTCVPIFQCLERFCRKAAWQCRSVAGSCECPLSER